MCMGGRTGAGGGIEETLCHSSAHHSGTGGGTVPPHAILYHLPTFTSGATGRWGFTAYVTQRRNRFEGRLFGRGGKPGVGLGKRALGSMDHTPCVRANGRGGGSQAAGGAPASYYLARLLHCSPTPLDDRRPEGSLARQNAARRMRAAAAAFLARRSHCSRHSAFISGYHALLPSTGPCHSVSGGMPTAPTCLRAAATSRAVPARLRLAPSPPNRPARRASSQARLHDTPSSAVCHLSPHYPICLPLTPSRCAAHAPACSYTQAWTVWVRLHRFSLSSWQT